MRAFIPLMVAMFINTYDSTAMNVALSNIAADLDTSVTGAKLGSFPGTKPAFRIGITIYGPGTLTTALSPNMAVLLTGYSLAEGIGSRSGDIGQVDKAPLIRSRLQKLDVRRMLQREWRASWP